MLLKAADYPYRLKFYEALSGRSELTKQQQKDYWSTKQGHVGEAEFVELLLKWDHVIILWDLTLVTDMKTSQFDVVVIYKGRIIHYDVKNYKGHYKLENGKLYSNADHLVTNPETQLLQAHRVLQWYAKQVGYTVESYIVNINVDFHLSSKDDDTRWLSRGRLMQHLTQYNASNVWLDNDQAVGEYLLQHHQPLKHLQQPVRIEGQVIASGIKCVKCKQVMHETIRSKKKVTCCYCGEVLPIHQLITENLKELYYLNNHSITLNDALKWCPGFSRITLSRSLNKEFKKEGHTKGAKYSL